MGEVSDMSDRIDADDTGVRVAAGEGDIRSTALLLMSEALTRLDSDHNIPAFIGAHLQSAIDALWISVSTDQRSIHLH